MLLENEYGPFLNECVCVCACTDQTQKTTRSFHPFILSVFILCSHSCDRRRFFVSFFLYQLPLFVFETLISNFFSLTLSTWNKNGSLRCCVFNFVWLQPTRPVQRVKLGSGR
ncbi:Hypothetical predicted protein [Scomber scombrus]|uniref:Uncharacterized protein n=1 Tax=Scomber scombrus TaxID=13677 RepID=A0AAV1PJR0_SCOSC